jgi:divalent metal cation (Fe/Co/Zn/Cd) transporter
VSTPDIALPRVGPATGEERHRLARRARLLSWLSLVWIGAEGAVGIASGVAAGSIALIGFGADSVIEGVASLIIIWRFSVARVDSDRAEHRAQRLVAIQFFLLAPYVAIESVHALIAGHHPGASMVGIVLAVTSAAGMPALGVVKRRLGERLDSRATQGEGTQNVLCGYLAVALLVGLVGNAVLGLWWLDAVVGLAIAGVAVREGRAAWRGQECCH